MRFYSCSVLALVVSCQPVSDNKSPSSNDSPGSSPDSRPDSRPDTESIPFGFPADLPPVDGRIAVLIVIDGLRTDEATAEVASPATGHTGRDSLPGIWARFGASGLTLSAMLNAGNTSTFPAHVTLFTGRPTSLWNVPTGGQPSLYRPETPTLFQAAAARCGEDRVHLIANAPLLMDASGSIYPSQRSAGHMDGALDGDTAVLDRFREAYVTEPCLIVLNLHDTDRQGHDDPVVGYPAALDTVDQQLAQLWDWLVAEQPERFSRTLTALTSDHGRHRDGPDPAWGDHGDSCGGCREVPLFLTGPGVQLGAADLYPHTLEDLSRLFAAYLDVQMPFATGLLPGWIAGLEAALPTGLTSLAAAGGHLAAVSPGATPEARSALTLDGSAVSSPDALAVADPALAATGDSLLLCWRELRRDAANDRWPWIPRCLYRSGGEFADIGFPTAEIEGAPVFAAALTASGAPLVAVVGSKDELTDSTLSTYQWDGDQWRTLDTYPIEFVTAPSLAATPDGWLLSVGGNAIDNYSRADRRVHLISPGGAQILPTPDPNVSTRVDRSAVRYDPEHLTTSVAALTVDPQATHLLLWQQDPSGLRPAATLPPGGEILPHLSPQWQGDTLAWAALIDGRAAICRLQIPSVPDPAATPACVDTGHAYLDSFALQADGTLLASAATTPGQWQLLTLTP